MSKQKSISKSISSTTRKIVLWPFRLISKFFNIQWKKDLNLLQNISYNVYLVSSSGKRSMHSTIVWPVFLAIMAIVVTEIRRVWKSGDEFSVQFLIFAASLFALVKYLLHLMDKFKYNNGLAQDPPEDDSEIIINQLKSLPGEALKAGKEIFTRKKSKKDKKKNLETPNEHRGEPNDLPNIP